MRGQGVEFVEKHLDGDAVRDHDRVASVVATVELDDVVDAAAEKVGGCAFAFVAPPASNDDDCRHWRPCSEGESRSSESAAWVSLSFRTWLL